MEVYTGSTTAQMATLFIWVGLANFVGALLIGPLFGRVNSMLLLSVCFVLMAVSGALSPTWPNLATFQALVAVASVFFAAILTGQLPFSAWCAVLDPLSESPEFGARGRTNRGYETVGVIGRRIGMGIPPPAD